MTPLLSATGQPDLGPGWFPVTLVCTIGTLLLWGWWYLDIARVTTLGSGLLVRLPLILAPLVGLALLALVPGDPFPFSYFKRYVLLQGAFWTGVSGRVASLLGVSVVDDVLERGNHPAAWTITGVMIGVVLCLVALLVSYQRQELSKEVFPVFGAVGVALLLITWGVVEWKTGAAERITVERDGGTGLRLGALLIAEGMLLGQGLSQVPSDVILAAFSFAVAVALLLAAIALSRAIPVIPLARPRLTDIVVAMASLGVAGLCLVVGR
jgi:uncharacterized membrane protein YjfL (UPF0719 family)